jgi:hypothetical protein
MKTKNVRLREAILFGAAACLGALSIAFAVSGVVVGVLVVLTLAVLLGASLLIWDRRSTGKVLDRSLQSLRATRNSASALDSVGNRARRIEAQIKRVGVELSNKGEIRKELGIARDRGELLEQRVADLELRLERSHRRLLGVVESIRVSVSEASMRTNKSLQSGGRRVLAILQNEQARSADRDAEFELRMAQQRVQLDDLQRALSAIKAAGNARADSVDAGSMSQEDNDVMRLGSTQDDSGIETRLNVLDGHLLETRRGLEAIQTLLSQRADLDEIDGPSSRRGWWSRFLNSLPGITKWTA